MGGVNDFISYIGANYLLNYLVADGKGCSLIWYQDASSTADTHSDAAQNCCSAAMINLWSKGADTMAAGWYRCRVDRGIRALIVLQIHSADNHNIDPQSAPRLLLIHPNLGWYQGDSAPPESKSWSQKWSKIVANPSWFGLIPRWFSTTRIKILIPKLIQSCC